MENEKVKKPFYKKWIFWIIVIIIAVAIAVNNLSSQSNNGTSSNDNYQKNSNVEVTIVDFSTMTRDEVNAWFSTNKINGQIKDEYSETIAKGNFISQSIATNTVVHEGDRITVTYSLGKEPTAEEKNALKTAENYSRTMHMSKNRIYMQLTSSYGEGFSTEAAQYAIDNIEVDWNKNALEKAKDYRNTMHMSKNRIYEQLTSSYGEGFTASEAQYAIDHLDD